MRGPKLTLPRRRSASHQKTSTAGTPALASTDAVADVVLTSFRRESAELERRYASRLLRQCPAS